MEETRRLVEKHFGKNQRECFNSYTKPFNHRLYHARYHFQEVQRLLKEEIDEKLPDKSIVELLLVEADSFQPIFLKIEAHMIACAQSIHSITDIFSHATYYALGLNLGQKPLNDQNINFKNVIKSINEERFLTIRNKMNELLENNLYKTLESLVTQGKHRGLPEPTIVIETEKNIKPYNLQFSKFNFRDKKHSEYEFQELLSPAYAMTSQMVVRCGILINEALSSCN